MSEQTGRRARRLERRQKREIERVRYNEAFDTVLLGSRSYPSYRNFHAYAQQGVKEINSALASATDERLRRVIIPINYGCDALLSYIPSHRQANGYTMAWAAFDPAPGFGLLRLLQLLPPSYQLCGGIDGYYVFRDEPTGDIIPFRMENLTPYSSQIITPVLHELNEHTQQEPLHELMAILQPDYQAYVARNIR